MFELAQRVRHKPLGLTDQALFKSMNSELFAPVLSALNTTVQVNAALAISSSAPLNRYYAIKEALIHAVRSVHIPWKLLPTAHLAAINAELRTYQRVFSSNYDLLCHWAVNQAPHGFAELFDEEGDFDVSRAQGPGTRMHYLHGGLHLLRTQHGTTRQRAASGSQLLDGFAINTPGDVPLFVNEDSSDNKLRAIRGSDYLTWCYAALATQREGLCVFGHHLDRADRHLVEAIRQAQPTHLAISILPVNEAAIVSQKQHYARVFEACPGIELHFSMPPRTRWARWRMCPRRRPRQWGGVGARPAPTGGREACRSRPCRRKGRRDAQLYGHLVANCNQIPTPPMAQ